MKKEQTTYRQNSAILRGNKRRNCYRNKEERKSKESRERYLTRLPNLSYFRATLGARDMEGWLAGLDSRSQE